jgi:hypothetical protein
VSTSSSTAILLLTSDAENATYYQSSVSVTAGNSYRLIFRYRGTYANGATVDNIQVYEESSDPEITVGSAISSLNYASGSGPSTSQSTAVSGSNLEADITLTAPTNFEISTDNSNFYNSLTLSHSGGTVSSTPIHARLKSGLSINSYSGNITASSTNATSKTIALSGTVYNGENSSVNYYVDDSGSDSNNGLTDSAPFATLSQAISTATSGIATIINVGAGTYTEHTVNVNKTNLIIRGAGSSSTIFDSNTTNKGFMSITASNVTVEKIKIKDYNFTSYETTSNAYGGGAIRVGAVPGVASVNSTFSAIVFNDIYFHNNSTNSTSGDGGAIAMISQSASATTTLTVNSCTFEGNSAGTSNSFVDFMSGSAIMAKNGSRLTVNNSLFFDNKTDYRGAVTTWTGAETTINNSTFYNNTGYSTSHSSIYNWFGATQTINNSIVYNSYKSDGSGGTTLAYDVYGYGGTTTINKTLMRDYTTWYSNDSYTATVNIDSYSSTNKGATPSFTDASSDDYSLQSSSVAIDAGSATHAPSDDINDLTRPQGQADDLGAYEHANTWTGSSSTAWATASNWSENIVPASDRSPVIADVDNDPDITTDVTLKDITINSGAILDINSTGSLTLTADFTNSSGTVNLNSASGAYPSVIVNGTSSGNITYNRYVNTVGSGEWDLVASPVGSLSISSFVSDNSSPLAQNSGTYALGYYDNSDDSWTNYTTSTTGGAGNFPLGKGYQMASTSGATLTFTGTVATSAQTQSVINNDGNGSGTRWNLVANPFPSYINLNDNNDATNNFLTVNSSKIDSDYLAVYGYDADGTGYSIYNHAGDSPGDYIAPGQAFFIAAASSSSDNISFTTAMRTTSGGDDFVSGRLAQSTWSRFHLRLYEDENFTSETKFYFDQGLSLGLDPGYDAGALNQSDDMMSRLTEEDQGIGMAMNAMGLSALDEETVIPLVLNRDAGVEFSISFEDSTIPEDVGVYLEDTLLETLTDLRSEDFTLTPESDLSDMGRFYLRIGNTSLGGNDLDESYISIYKAASDDFVTIEGLSNVEKANVQLFNIIGQEVLNTTLNSNQSTQRVSTSGLTTGVYVIRLQADSSVIAKKIIIN